MLDSNQQPNGYWIDSYWDTYKGVVSMVEVFSKEWQEIINELMKGFPEEYDFSYMEKPELSGNVTWDMVPTRMKQGYRILKGKGKNEIVIVWLQDFEKIIGAVKKNNE